MKRLKRLSALCLAAGLCILPLAGCAEESSPLAPAVSACVGASPVTLDPIYAEEVSDQTILVHLYENLMRVGVDASGTATVENGTAKSVSMEEEYDGTVTYTFRLRSAKWSDGKSVTAQDFVYAWRRLAAPASQSPYASLLSIVSGYDAARASGDMTQLAVTAKNANTLVVELDGHYDWFLREVCTSPATMPLREDVLQELKTLADERNALMENNSGTERWWSASTRLVTNGPFTASTRTPEAMVLSANPEYTGGAAGLESLTFRFAQTPGAAWALYETGEVDAVWPLPDEQLTELAAKEDWSPEPMLSSYSVLFNCARLPDVKVRQALAAVIDSGALATLAGPLAKRAEGLVPPGVPGLEGSFRAEANALPEHTAQEYEALCAQARDLLSAAGYDDDIYLGTVEFLYAEEGSNKQVAEALCRMWERTLGIHVTPKGLTEQALWEAVRGGNYVLAGAELTAVCGDAECFLMRWNSDSGDNVIDYESSAYDTLMSIIAGAEDGSARMGCLHDAEDLLLNIDCALAPLYTTGTAWALREPLTGICRDSRGWFVFGGVAAGVSAASH